MVGDDRSTSEIPMLAKSNGMSCPAPLVLSMSPKPIQVIWSGSSDSLYRARGRHILVRPRFLVANPKDKKIILPWLAIPILHFGTRSWVYSGG
ncbi:MAG: hypothetical protein Ct9H90mP16_18570 [Candidatus Poseidoniales archaeon]|nr:MAG: hypothetical protein Ct9H90mP16_18570 [Candidatus Poseidoniales archaeon]